MKLSKGKILELDVTSLAYGGLGISHYNDITIFVKGGLPGDKLKAKIYKKKKNYLEAYSLEKIEKSDYYTNPQCEHYGICGGCSLQDLNYNEQLNQKYVQVKDLFHRIGKFSSIPINNIIGCEQHYGYRNKMEFSYSSNKWIVDLNEKDEEIDSTAFGLHVKSRFDKIVDVNDCHINGKLSNKIFQFIKQDLHKYNIIPFDIKKRTGFLRNVIIRQGHATNQILINFIITQSDNSCLIPIAKNLVREFDEIKSVLSSTVKRNSGSSFSDEEKILWGEDYITEKINENIYKISSNSFFQTNSKQAKVLYDLIIQIAGFKGNEIVYDLYCGTGSIGLHIAKHVKMVYGIEVVMSAVIDAIENAKNNKINNIHFFHGDLITVFNSSEELKLIPKPNIIILDPPRAGIHENTLNEILKFNSKKIIYVSCNPSTQARDIKLISEHNYKIKNIQPVDMFPHTPHIENIVLMEKYE